jgi:ABC-type lipoprotein export system ATPase subunit
MISLQNVSRKYYLDAETNITPVRDVNLDVHKGEFVLLVGRSGSGKTSLLNLAAGLIKPTSGKVFIKDIDISNLTDRQLSSLRARTIGFVFQYPSLIPSLNALENTLLPRLFTTRRGYHTLDNERAINLLKKVGLNKRLRAFPNQLSAGEQKRVVLARALMNEPEILLADEPTSDLDDLTEQDIMQFLRELHSGGITILMVTHGTNLIPFADRTMSMKEGNLVNLSSDL